MLLWEYSKDLGIQKLLSNANFPKLGITKVCYQRQYSQEVGIPKYFIKGKIHKIWGFQIMVSKAIVALFKKIKYVIERQYL